MLSSEVGKVLGVGAEEDVVVTSFISSALPAEVVVSRTCLKYFKWEWNMKV